MQRSLDLRRPEAAVDGLARVVRAAQLVEAGLGVGLMAERYYLRELRSRRLVRLRTGAKVPDVEYFAVYRRANQRPAVADLAQLAQTVCDFGLRDAG